MVVLDDQEIFRWARHHHRRLAGAAGPDVTATHPTDGTRLLVLTTFSDAFRFTCAATGDVEPPVDKLEYQLYDTVQNQAHHPVQVADLGEFWAVHGFAGLSLLDAMDTAGDPAAGPWAPTPLSHRLAAARTALGT